MEINEIKEILIDENPNAMLVDDFDNALIGISRRCGQPALAVYSVTKCLDILQEDMGYDEAVEYFEFNVLNAWHGDGTPIFLLDDY